MNVRSPRRAAPWVVLFLVAGAAGCTCTHPSPTKLSQCPVQNKEHVVLLRAEKQADGNWKAIAHPDFITVRGYDPDKPDTVVIWGYHYASTRITFEKKVIPEPTCNDKTGECKLDLPKGLTPNHKYKYTVTGTVMGEHGEKIPLVPNDPWIEVDR